MKKNSLFFNVHFFLLCTLLACSSSPQTTGDFLVAEGDRIATLQSERILHDEIGLADLKRINDFLILATSQDTLLKIFDQQLNPVGRFGRTGRGPGEFLRPPMIKDYRPGDDGTAVLVYDDIKRKLIEFHLERSIEQGSLELIREFEFPEAFAGTLLLDLFYLSDHTYVATYDDRSAGVLNKKRGGLIFEEGVNAPRLFDLKNLSIEPYETFPELNLNNRSVGRSGDRRTLYSAFRYSPFVEVFHLDAPDRPALQLYPEEPPPDTYRLDEFNDRALVEHFRDIHVGERYIYLLYTGYPFGDDPPDQGDYSIRIITRDGQPVYQFLIDAKEDIRRFIVDEHQKHIIGLSWSMDALYRYDFSDSEFTP
ncbi:MAG: hypothetical protein ACNA78_11600 [Balneolaceae bacterium]